MKTSINLPNFSSEYSSMLETTRDQGRSPVGNQASHCLYYCLLSPMNTNINDSHILGQFLPSENHSEYGSGNNMSTSIINFVSLDCKIAWTLKNSSVIISS